MQAALGHSTRLLPGTAQGAPEFAFLMPREPQPRQQNLQGEPCTRAPQSLGKFCCVPHVAGLLSHCPEQNPRGSGANVHVPNTDSWMVWSQPRIFGNNSQGLLVKTHMRKTTMWLEKGPYGGRAAFLGQTPQLWLLQKSTARLSAGAEVRLRRARDRRGERDHPRPQSLQPISRKV